MPRKNPLRHDGVADIGIGFAISDSRATSHEFRCKEKIVHPHTQTALRPARLIVILVSFACIFAACFANQLGRCEKPASANSVEPSGEQSDGNNKCYVCHPAMKTEDVTTSHLKMDITCDECHGSSIEHMHDEMLMTRPDLLFGRSEVNKMCSNPTCHKPGDERGIYGRQDHKDPEKVEAFFKEWRGRTRPNGRAVTADSICTDCHGKHNLDEAVGTQTEQEETVEWVAAFDGNDLAGWERSGSATWSIKAGRIVGACGTARNGKGGTLWSRQNYENYLLAVTFQTTGPVHAGICLRGTDSQPGPRIEIFGSPKPAPDRNIRGWATAFTGSVWLPEIELVLVNFREGLVDNEGWNTISARVEGDKVQVWLNGVEIGSVRVTSAAKGKIGLHIERDPESKTAELCVREVLVHRLTKF